MTDKLWKSCSVCSATTIRKFHNRNEFEKCCLLTLNILKILDEKFENVTHFMTCKWHVSWIIFTFVFRNEKFMLFNMMENMRIKALFFVLKPETFLFMVRNFMTDRNKHLKFETCWNALISLERFFDDLFFLLYRFISTLWKCWKIISAHLIENEKASSRVLEWEEFFTEFVLFR